ncbi:MAG TPA: c-type cytochrome [Caldimonas sp.]|nr:c-type cytochrome [Caldimonas sp.]
MTAAHEPNDIDGPHEGPIKTPKQLILAVLYAFVVPIFGIVLLVMFVTSGKRPAAGTDAMSPQAVAERIRPVGMVEVKDASDVGSLKTGDQVFAAQCSACHASGALGAPKLGDATAWAARIKTGLNALVHSAVAGKGQMPPQSGGDFSDYEIARAVVYMTSKAGANFPEPAPPAATTQTSTTSPAAAGNGAAGTTAMAAAAPSTGGSPQPDANAGKPEATPQGALNVQLRDVPPNADPGQAKTQVAANTAAATTAPAAATAAPALYAQICSTCHAAGIAGAPKVGDKAAWAPRIAQGIDTLTTNAIKGKGAMPPKGGSSASDADIKAVVTYMVGASK